MSIIIDHYFHINDHMHTCGDTMISEILYAYTVVSKKKLTFCNRSYDSSYELKPMVFNRNNNRNYSTNTIVIRKCNYFVRFCNYGSRNVLPRCLLVLQFCVSPSCLFRVYGSTSRAEGSERKNEDEW